MMRVMIMGVSGAGKSLVGAGLSTRLGVRFVEGDDLHPSANVEKMRSGIPLTDDDRWPWLDRVADVLSDDAPVVVTCSALKRIYRERIKQRARGPVLVVHLSGGKEAIRERLALRKGHFMPPSLLDSQFATLETPSSDEAFSVDALAPLDDIVETIAKEFEAKSPNA